MSDRPRWEVEGIDWPHRSASRFVRAAGFQWHVQIIGQGPALLLIHGTGAASHSWRDLVPKLADRFTLIIPDLPGHGFSDWRSPNHLSLPHMARQLADLISSLERELAAIIGHSAGAAIGLQMALDGRVAPQHIVSVNGALRPFTGIEGVLYPALAKLLFLNPLTTALVARRAHDSSAIAKVIAGTGSRLDAKGLDFYVRLMRTRRHVAATLGMMANWDLRPLQRSLPSIAPRVTLIAARNDRAVPLQIARDAAAQIPDSRLI